MRLPPFHPSIVQAADTLCPTCGRPGEKVRDLFPPFEEWACRRCEPEAFEETGR